jgi:hypothetical protein
LCPDVAGFAQVPVDVRNDARIEYGNVCRCNGFFQAVDQRRFDGVAAWSAMAVVLSRWNSLAAALIAKGGDAGDDATFA